MHNMQLFIWYSYGCTKLLKKVFHNIKLGYFKMYWYTLKSLPNFLLNKLQWLLDQEFRNHILCILDAKGFINLRFFSDFKRWPITVLWPLELKESIVSHLKTRWSTISRFPSWNGFSAVLVALNCTYLVIVDWPDMKIVLFCLFKQRPFRLFYK